MHKIIPVKVYNKNNPPIKATMGESLLLPLKILSNRTLTKSKKAREIAVKA